MEKKETKYYKAMCKTNMLIRVEAKSLEAAKEKLAKFKPIGPVTKDEN